MRRLKALAVVAGLFLIAACAPSYASIYDSDSAIVSGGTGAQGQNTVWTIGTTTHTTRDYTAAQWSVDCGTKDSYGLRAYGGTTTDPDNGAYGGLIRASQARLSQPWETNSTGSSSVTVSFTGGSRTSNVVTLTGVGTHTFLVGEYVTVSAADTSYNGKYVVTAVTASTVKYAQTAANDASSGAGTITRDQYGYHYCPGLKSETAGFVFDRWHISGVGDGFVDRDNGAYRGDKTRFSRSWVVDSGDDCVQSDSGANDVSIQEVFCDNAWAGISARQGSGDFSGSTIDVTDSLIHVGDHPVPTCYHYLAVDGGKKCGSGGGHAGWLKWYSPKSQAARLIARGNVWAAGSYPRNSGDLAMNAPVPAESTDHAPGDGVNDWCDSNVLLLLTPTSDPNYAADAADFATDVATWTAAGCTNTIARTTADTGTENALYRYLVAANGWHQSHDGLIQAPGTP